MFLLFLQFACEMWLGLFVREIDTFILFWSMNDERLWICVCLCVGFMGWPIVSPLTLNSVVDDEYIVIDLFVLMWSLLYALRVETPYLVTITNLIDLTRAFLSPARLMLHRQMAFIRLHSISSCRTKILGRKKCNKSISIHSMLNAYRKFHSKLMTLNAVFFRSAAAVRCGLATDNRLSVRVTK